MSAFGDFEPADAIDPDPPDPEALARIFYRARHRLAPDPSRAATLDDEPPLVRALVVFAFADVVRRVVAEWRP